MKKLLALLLLSTASVAMAHNCPNEMKAIDAKMQSSTLTEADTAKLKLLRAQGEKFHKEGNHSESMKSLGEAKKLLGL